MYSNHNLSPKASQKKKINKRAERKWAEGGVDENEDKG
jgi:hypothetical protein